MTLSLIEIFASLGLENALSQSGLEVTSPTDGAIIATVVSDNDNSLDKKILTAAQAQKNWCQVKREERVHIIQAYAEALKAEREMLGNIVHLESGKTPKESLGEVDAAIDIIGKTIKDASLADLNGMGRTKERAAIGTIGLITSFNFPIAVAHWTIAPALLAANAVVWKPSEKTPLVALACKALFDKAAAKHKDLLQIAVGARDIGEKLIAHEQIDMVSATGSVAMGKGIKKTLALKKNNNVSPILELGGNNGVILSEKCTPAHLEWAIKALMGSFLGTTGQRCTDTRRIIAHRSVYARAVELFKQHAEEFLSTAIKNNAIDSTNEFGYGPLIDENAYKRFEQAKSSIIKEGGEILLGRRLFESANPHAYFVEPGLALLPKPAPIMLEETFAPLLFLVPYDNITQAFEILNAPENAGLVSGIYTQSRAEADLFAAKTQSGHCLINSPKGTSTPAFGMGFGGNKDSGCGEILNSADPLQAFTRPATFRRIAENKDVAMDYNG